MLSDADPNSSFWTIATLLIVFGLIPAIVYFLGKAAINGMNSDQEQTQEARRLKSHEELKRLYDAQRAQTQEARIDRVQNKKQRIITKSSKNPDPPLS